jgi:hypothetical protein
MIGVCAGYFRPEFFFREMIILRESNSHARRQVYIPHMGSQLQTSCKVDLTRSRKAAEGEMTQTENITQSSGMIQLNNMIARDASAVFRHRPPWATAADRCPDDFGFCLLGMATVSRWTFILRYLRFLLFEA